MGKHFDFVARIADIVARKSQQLPVSIGAFLRDIENKVLSKGLRGTLKSLVDHFQKEKTINAAPAVADLEAYAEWMVLVERIHQFGRTETIENYPAYMISLDGL